MTKTVVCLQWGKKPYTSDWVYRLYQGVCNHLTPPFRFICFSDNPNALASPIEARDISQLSLSPDLHGIWWKLALLHPQANLQGQCLFLDLDTVIIDNLDVFFQHPGQFCIIKNWIETRKVIFRKTPPIGNSSVFRFIGGNEKHVTEKFIKNPTQAKDKNFFRTEQSFLTHAIGIENITWWPSEWVRSYKRHCLPTFPMNWISPPTIPLNCRIIAFHGSPKPDEAIRGQKMKWHKFSRPMPILKNYWK